MTPTQTFISNMEIFSKEVFQDFANAYNARYSHAAIDAEDAEIIMCENGVSDFDEYQDLVDFRRDEWNDRPDHF